MMTKRQAHLLMGLGVAIILTQILCTTVLVGKMDSTQKSARSAEASAVDAMEYSKRLAGTDNDAPISTGGRNMSDPVVGPPYTADYAEATRILQDHRVPAESPKKPLSEEQQTLFTLQRLLDDRELQAVSPFQDVHDSWPYRAMSELQAENLVRSYPAHHFDGNRVLTRYEFAVGVKRVLDLEGFQPSTEGGLSVPTQRALTRLIYEFTPELNELGIHGKWMNAQP